MNAHQLFFAPRNSLYEFASLGAWYVVIGWVGLVEVAILTSIWPNDGIFIGQIGCGAFFVMGLFALIGGRR